MVDDESELVVGIGRWQLQLQNEAIDFVDAERDWQSLRNCVADGSFRVHQNLNKMEVNKKKMVILQTPSCASTTITTPSASLKAAVISSEKFTCPGKLNFNFE